MNTDINLLAGTTSTFRQASLIADMYDSCIMMHMRTTLNIDDDLLNRAAKLTGIKEKTALVRAGLEALISQESARRLAALGGSEPDLKPTRRRRATGSR
jgi:Arc/MetJ family transcription regulator